MFMRIEGKQGDKLWFNLMTVTHVTEAEDVSINIHFVGGAFHHLIGWSLKEWEEAINKIQRQVSLMMGKGGQA